MMLSFEYLGIKGLAACVPERVVSNAEFEHLLSAKELRFFEKTVGIRERRWAAKNVTASDLGFAAATRLLEQTRTAPSDIGALLFLSQTSDYIIPFTSNILQDRLGLPKAMLCLDINAGCAGFIQGLSMAYAIAQSLQPQQQVLLVVAETLSKILSPSDRATSMLFGDGAAAVLVGRTAERNATWFNTFSDGAHHQAIMIPDGGFRNCFTQESLQQQVDEKNNSRSNMNLQMDGQQVFDFTLREVTPGIQQLVAGAGLGMADIDYFLLHQSNHYIIRQIAAQLAVPEERMLVNIAAYGNTSGVSIPLVITGHPEEACKASRLLFSGYGSGLNWGNCITGLQGATILPTFTV